MDKFHILITDDEPVNLELMEEILEDKYYVSCVSSGPECIDFLKTNQPDILLLDVAMPNMSGYEVCRYIRTNTGCSIPILFISARGTLDDRLKGYEAGGHDYLSKPFNNQELIAKVQNMIALIDKQKKLDKQVKQSDDMTMMAMSNMGEIGVILNFLRQTFECDNFEHLTQVAFESLGNLNLKGTLQYHNKEEPVETFDSSGVYKPVEAEILKLTRDQGRIYQYNQRSIINFSHVSLLIKNMPISDKDKYGRLLDHICLMVEGLNARAIAITREQEIIKNAKKQKLILQQAKQGFIDNNKNLKSQKKRATEISTDLINQLEHDLLKLGLDDDQEKYLVDLIDSNICKLSDIFSEQDTIEKFFNQLINSCK